MPVDDPVPFQNTKVGRPTVPATAIGHAHPLDENVRLDTWGLVGDGAGRATMFSTCAACRDREWSPPDSAWEH